MTGDVISSRPGEIGILTMFLWMLKQVQHDGLRHSRFVSLAAQLDD